MTRDYRDLTIEHAVAENANLRADVVAYRELLQAALDRLASVTASYGRLREGHQRLIDEYRALRERLVADRTAA